MPGELSTTKVIIHPLVLLSVVDHYTRMSKIGNQKRVIGVLLGCWKQKGVLDVSNSFAGKKMRICLNNRLINSLTIS
jgi:26S proteasome regulatory subunit N8